MNGIGVVYHNFQILGIDHCPLRTDCVVRTVGNNKIEILGFEISFFQENAE